MTESLSHEILPEPAHTACEMSNACADLDCVHCGAPCTLIMHLDINIG